MLRSTRRGLETRHGRDGVTLADERASQQEHELRPKPARQSPTLPVRDGDGNVPIYSALGSAQRRKRGVESGSCGERGEIAEEGETAGLVQRLEAFEKKTAEQARQHAHGEEEAGPASDPTFAVQRKAAARNDHVEVRMMGERRAPGVQHGGETDARAQMLRVGGDGDERLGGGPEQEIVDDGLVLERDRADRRRQGENDVIIGDRQEFRLALGEPLSRRRALTLWAVAVAAGNGRRPLPALWAKFVMVSQWASISDLAGLEGFVVPITSGL